MISSANSVTELREELERIVGPHCNWEEFLVPAPMCVCLLGDLTLMSTMDDCMLEKKPPKDGFKLLRWPHSFRACLMQVANSGWETFNAAHNNMDQIRLLSGNVPYHLRDAVNILINGADDDIELMLPIPLEAIQKSAENCLALATEVENKFMYVMSLMAELIEACGSAEGHQLQETNIDLKIAEENKKTYEDRKRIAKTIYDELERSVRKAESSYKDAMGSSPSGYATIRMHVVEGMGNAFTSALSAILGCTLLEVKFGLRVTVMDTSALQQAAHNVRFKIQQSTAQLEHVQKQNNKACDSLVNSSQKLCDTMAEMSKLDMTKIDFEKIRETLINGIKALGELREQWDKLVGFLQMMSNIIKCCFNTSLNDFLKYTKATQKHSLKGYPISSLKKDMIYQQAFQAAIISHVVNMLSENYVEVSNKHLTHRIAGLGALMAFDSEKEMDKIQMERMKLISGCKEAQEDIRQLVLKRKGEFDSQLLAMIQEIQD